MENPTKSWNYYSKVDFSQGTVTFIRMYEQMDFPSSAAVFVGTGVSVLASSHDYIKQAYIGASASKFRNNLGAVIYDAADKVFAGILPTEETDSCITRSSTVEYHHLHD